MSYEGLLEQQYSEIGLALIEMGQIVEQGKNDALRGFPPQEASEPYLEGYLIGIKSLPTDIHGGIIYPDERPDTALSPDDEF